MNSADDFYAFISRIYDACVKSLRAWCRQNGFRLRVLQTTRCPEVEQGLFAVLWVFAEMEFCDRQGQRRRAKVVVVPSRFLESAEEDREGCVTMVFSTFGYDEPQAEKEVLVPIIFTDTTPAGFIVYLRDEKRIQVGKEVFIVTPEGLVPAVAASSRQRGLLP